MNVQMIKTSQASSINQKARLLMVNSFKRQYKRQSSILQRSMEQINFL